MNMSRPAFTVHIFSIYLLGLGIGLALFPNLLLLLFSVAQTSEIWIRVVGILVFRPVGKIRVKTCHIPKTLCR